MDFQAAFQYTTIFSDFIPSFTGREQVRCTFKFCRVLNGSLKLFDNG